MSTNPTIAIAVAGSIADGSFLVLWLSKDAVKLMMSVGGLIRRYIYIDSRFQNGWPETVLEFSASFSSWCGWWS